MPVEDHPIHPSTRHGEGFRYGCNNDNAKPAGYYVLTRYYFNDGRYELRNEYIGNTASTACRNMSYDTDPACRDCPQPKDLEYINRMKELLSQPKKEEK